MKEEDEGGGGGGGNRTRRRRRRRVGRRMRNTLGRALTPVGCQNAFVMFYILLCFQCLHFPYLGVYRNREDIQKRMNKLAQMGKNKENGTSVGRGHRRGPENQEK